ncbi:MAG TPA: SNF2-related protein [Streptosporangiaceae bacterium]|nr:SNF2-related protein [Streptosporangiaceae bacterium]
MEPVVLPGIDPGSCHEAVGAACFARGAQYAWLGAVQHMWWHDSDCSLHGRVRGSAPEPYSTTVYFSPGRGRLVFEASECSCPVGFDCKHAVALVLTAAGVAAPQAASPQTSTPGAASARDTGRDAWERSLESLLTRGAGVDRSGSRTVPLAIELTLSRAIVAPQSRGSPPAAVPLKLSARLVQPGKNGWVGGNLSWARLDSLTPYAGYHTDQVRLLQEMRAVYQAGARQVGYYFYGSSADRTIDLTSFDSEHLWPLLDHAASVGVALVYPRKLGDIGRYRDAEFCLDVTRGDPSGPLRITPSLRVDGQRSDATMLAFIGSEGHGVVCAGPDVAERGNDPAGWRFWLARLAKPVPRQLQQMALAGEWLEVPAAQQAKFRDGYYLRLRRVATVTSSDGSFTPPQVEGPALVLSASYAGGHEVEARWEWAYQVGDTQLRTSVGADPGDAGYRDIQAERLILAGLDTPLERFGLAPVAQEGAGPSRPAQPVHLSGLATMRFTTELLPRLADRPGVSVEVSGEPADYREVGDSLRIALSTDEVAGDTDWFDLGLTITVEGREVPFVAVFTALSRGETYLMLDDGAYFSLEKPELRALAALIEEARALHDSPPGELRISPFQAGLWDELAELADVSHQATTWQRNVQGLLDAGAFQHAEPPAALTARLRPYQVDGFGWLAFLWEHQLGGILADDMGLGKTLQSLALITHARQSAPDSPPFLVVAPTSVVANWATEASRFAPKLRVVTVTETAARRGEPLGGTIAGADVVVTSYTLLRIDFADYGEFDWSGLILDEAQYIKNHQSKTHTCARRLRAPFKAAITGTPMENNLMELWSLLSVTAPGLFPNQARFRKYYAQPIETQGNAELLAQLRRRIRPLVKRRTKEQVAADLPPKQEQVLEVDLHPRHRKVYQTHLQRERQKVLGLLDDLNAHRFTILSSLTLLRQLSLHAGLADDTHHDLPSAKVDALLDQLHDVAGSGHRALVFSQFTRFLAKVRHRLENEAIPYCYLDGNTRDRAAVLRRFREGDDPVFLISLKAGGFGLNLTEADYCFLLDPWWNPATEAQAVDRTHRIGQTRNVMVYRLIAKDTIEEKVMALKARKAELFTSVLDDGNFFDTTLDADDIRNLLA